MEIGMEENYGWNMVEEGWRKGPWTAEEDRLLIEYVKIHGEGRWTSVAKLAGLKRNGKSCRLRWVNYLRPDLKRGKITPNEERIILEMHAIWGNRWSIIARSLPGRTDNEIKNYWRTHFKKVKTGNGNMDDESKARMLRMQQFHHHHQYQYQQQQHHQQQQLMQQTQQAEDMQRIMSMMLDDNDSDTNTAPSLLPQIKLDSSGFICYGSNTPDEIGLLYSMINDYAETEPETTIHDHDHDTPSSDGGGIVWDGSWNIDDGVNGNINYSTL